MKLSQAMYEAAQAAEGEREKTEAAAKGHEAVVDADFEEIDENGKKKSA